MRASCPAPPRKRESPATTSPRPPVLAKGVTSAATWSTRSGTASDHRSRRDHGILGHDDDAVADRVILVVGILHTLGVDQLAAVADAGVEVDDGVADVAVVADADGRRVAVLLPVIGAH